MGTGPEEETLPYERLAEQELNVLSGPISGWQRLQEHQDFLKVHLDKLIGPLDEKSGANIQVELREALLFRL